MEFFTQKIKVLTPTHARLVKRGVLAGKDGCIRCTCFFPGIYWRSILRKETGRCHRQACLWEGASEPRLPLFGALFPNFPCIQSILCPKTNRPCFINLMQILQQETASDRAVFDPSLPVLTSGSASGWQGPAPSLHSWIIHARRYPL